MTWPWAHEEDEKWPLKNVWVGTSVEDQETVNERIPHLMRDPCGCALDQRGTVARTN